LRKGHDLHAHEAAVPLARRSFAGLRSIIVTSARFEDNHAPTWPREPTRREAAVKANLAPGLHVAPGHAANVLAYDGWVGRWSRLFVPTVITAAEVSPGCRVLDISTGTSEAALMTLPTVGASGVVIGADVAPAMLVDSRDRLKDPSSCPVAADGQALPFKSGRFEVVICQPGLQFFADPAPGLTEFRRVSEARGRERAFGTLQNRLPSELRLASITTIAEANRYLAVLMRC
jgi:SAM-dependent methyltransferase